ncbi:GLUG motif-containing protein [Halorussus amylolyticus]|uniref:GLUG motif-containing protein n=1 Tax=Halorussus amylolyticus TaxID=1126242 RepID=UPI00138F6EBA|nr:GLUG motif-containing protein [Halorussus amylolyticus]
MLLFGGMASTASAVMTAPDCSTVGYDGSGTASSPYEVGNVEQVQCIGENHDEVDSRSTALDSDYELTGNIDANGTSDWNGGAGFDPIGGDDATFTGSFEGDGYTVSNLTVNRSDEDESGLFGHVGYGGTVTNLTVGGEVTGASAVGIVAGVNGGTVSRTTSNGSVDGSTAVGGVVGQNDAVISNVSSDASASGDDRIGGLAGNNTDTGGETVIRDSFAVGEVTAETDGGGLVGENEGAVTEAYWDTEASGVSEAVGTGDGSVDARGLTTEEMQGLNGWFFMDDLFVLDYYIAVFNSEKWFDRWVPTEGYPTLTSHYDGSAEPDPADITDKLLEGSGTETDPYNVTTVGELQSVKENVDEFYNLDGHYVLGTDIDASGTEHWNDGDGFEPILFKLNGKTFFSGTFDGQGHTISNLTLTPSNPAGTPGAELPNTTAWGVFDTVGSNGEVRNLVLEDVQLAYGSESGPAGGGVAGVNDGTVENVSVSGEVAAGPLTGGVVGENRQGATLRNATSTGTVTSVSAERSVGGVVGNNRGSVERSVASGEVESNETSAEIWVNVGGFVGDNSGGTITDSRVEGDVQSDGINDVEELNVGGFAGENNDGTITNSHAVGEVKSDGRNAAGTLNVGGFVGDNNGGTIKHAYAVGDVRSDELNGAGHEEPRVNVGGFVGRNDDGAITDAYATGEVQSGELDEGEELSVGGFGGNVTGTVERSYAIGTVSVSGNPEHEDVHIAGFAGLNSEGTVEDSYWDTEETGYAGPTGNDDGSGDAIGFTTANMTGANATANMDGFTFTDAWHATDSYPVLAWQDADPFFGVNVTETNTPVIEGDSLDITVTVTNFGGDGGSQTVTLSDTDFENQQRVSAVVDLQSGESNDSVGLEWRETTGTLGSGDITVTSENDTDTVAVTVQDVTPPNADAGPNRTLKKKETVEFDGSDSTDNGDIDRYEWDIDDDGTYEENGATLEHSFADPGRYNVTLRVTDRGGNNDTDTVAVVVKDTNRGGGGGGVSSPSDEASGDDAGDTQVVRQNIDDSTTRFAVGADEDEDEIVLDLTEDDEGDEGDGGENTTSVGPDLQTVGLDSLSIRPTEDGQRDFEVTVRERNADTSASEPDDGGRDTTARTESDSGSDSTAAPGADDRRDPRAFLEETGATPTGYVDINHTNPDSDIENVTFQFRVRKSYLDEADVGPDSVALYRDETDRWNELDAEKVGESATHHVFEAESPGLSLFTIGSTRPVFEVADVNAETESVEVGEDATVEVTVENLGGKEGTHAVELQADDDPVASDEVAVAGRTTTTVSLSFTPDEAGEYDLAIDGRDAGALVVEQAGSNGDSDVTAQESEEGTDESGEADDDDDTGDSDVRLLGGLLAAVVALASVVVWRRGEDGEHAEENQG